MMLHQTPLVDLYRTDTPRPTRAGLPPVPALMVTEPTATLEGNMRDVRTVAQMLVVLIDGAAHMTDFDRDLVRRLFQIACEDFGS